MDPDHALDGDDTMHENVGAGMEPYYRALVCRLALRTPSSASAFRGEGTRRISCRLQETEVGVLGRDAKVSPLICVSVIIRAQLLRCR